MKNTNKCPKCNGHGIIFIEGYAGAYGSGNYIKAGVTIFSAVKVDRYVCANCGYSEEWIRQEDIPTLKDKKGVMLEE